MRKSCESCEHWNDLEDETGVCHRYPPVLDVLHALDEINRGAKDLDYAEMGIAWWSFPRTPEGQWCGEWKKRSNVKFKETQRNELIERLAKEAGFVIRKGDCLNEKPWWNGQAHNDAFEALAKLVALECCAPNETAAILPKNCKKM